MSDIFAEVDAFMRQERLAKIWHDNQAFILIVIIGSIVFTGALAGYRSWDASVQIAQTERALELTKALNFPDNFEASELSGLRPSLRGLVLLQAAGAALERDQTDQALGFYQSILEDKAIKSDLRDMAALAHGYLSDKAHALDVKSPFYAYNLLDQAMNAAAAEDFQTARDHLNALIALDTVPQALLTRAQQLLALYALHKGGEAAL